MAEEMGGDWDIAHPGWRTRFAQYFGGKQCSGRAAVFVALAHGEIVGTAIVSIVDDYRAFALHLASAHVNAVYVAPPFRRQGIARRMVEHAIAWARERKCVRVRLRTSAGGAALYASLGFRTGTEMELML